LSYYCNQVGGSQGPYEEVEGVGEVERRHNISYIVGKEVALRKNHEGIQEQYVNGA